MPYVIKNQSTGNYLTTSTAKSVDYKNVVYARVYPTQKGARSAAKYYQDLYSSWFRTEEFLLKRDGELPGGRPADFNGVAPDWIVEEI